ncbi:MAG TPA: GAF domain-containing protein [Gammaproteobacteria bacterium]|nr:GAF domain-containing protein [Gammaproteobacteria bacterium]
MRTLVRVTDIRILDQFYIPVEERFERLTRLARSVPGIAVAAVSIVTPRRQRFKSVVGWNVTELPIELNLCRTTISEGGIVVVPDALRDKRFANHPLVDNSRGFRFYVGYP